MEHRESRKSAQLIAYALIALGTVIAINELNLFSLNYWPIMLIATTTAFIIGKQTRILALLAVFALGAGYYLFQPTSSQAQSQTNGLTQTIEQTLDGANSVKLELSPSVASLDLSALTDSNLVAQGSVRLASNESLESSYCVKDDGNASYTLESKTNRGWFSNWFNLSDTKDQWVLALTPSVPLDLNIDSGVGESMLNLQDLTLTKLDINTGVGEADITLPKQGNFKASIESGVGSIIVRIPKSLAVQINLDQGLGSTDIDAYFYKTAFGYESPNFDSASQQVELNIESGVGSIELRSF